MLFALQKSMNVLEKLYKTLQERKNSDTDSSYVASLYVGGARKMNAKILEEAQEVVTEISALEAMPDQLNLQENLKNEAADLIFHLWVALAYHDIMPADVDAVLEKRLGTSGHDEKSARQK